MFYCKQDVEEMLKKYLLTKSQLEKIKFNIERDVIQLQSSNQYYEDTDDEVISSMQLSSPVISDIPKSTTNKVSRTVENTVLNYHKEKNYKNKVDVFELKTKIERNRNKESELSEVVTNVEIMIKALNNQQRLVITSYYMNDCKWDYVANTYLSVYRQTRTTGQLKNIRDEALDKMVKVINV